MQNHIYKRIVEAVILAAALVAFCVTAVMAYEKYPGKGIEVKQGRCTWDTGYFHETLIRKAMIELGYTFERPKMLQNSLFYASVSQGTIDFLGKQLVPQPGIQATQKFLQNRGCLRLCGEIRRTAGISH